MIRRKSSFDDSSANHTICVALKYSKLCFCKIVLDGLYSLRNRSINIRGLFNLNCNTSKIEVGGCFCSVCCNSVILPFCNYVWNFKLSVGTTIFYPVTLTIELTLLLERFHLRVWYSFFAVRGDWASSVLWIQQNLQLRVTAGVVWYRRTLSRSVAVDNNHSP